ICIRIDGIDTLVAVTAMRSLSVKSLSARSRGSRATRTIDSVVIEATPITSCGVPLVRAHIVPLVRAHMVSSAGEPLAMKSTLPERRQGAGDRLLGHADDRAVRLADGGQDLLEADRLLARDAVGDRRLDREGGQGVAAGAPGGGERRAVLGLHGEQSRHAVDLA